MPADAVFGPGVRAAAGCVVCQSDHVRKPLVEAVRHRPTVVGFLSVGIVGTVIGAFVRAAYDDGYTVTVPGLLPTMAGWIIGTLVAVAVIRRLAPRSGRTLNEGGT